MPPLSRRHALQLLGATAGATLVGCSRSEEAEDAEASFRTWYPYSAPPAGNLNTLGGITDAIPQAIGYLADYIVLPGAMYKWTEQAYYYLLADESTTLSPDGKTLTYNVRPDQQWSDGTPITAKDVYATWMCRYVIRNPAYDYVDKVELTDDMTVTFHIGTPAPIVQYYLLRERIVPDSVYGDFAKRAEPMMQAKADAVDSKVSQLSKQLAAYKPDTVIASGPYNIDIESISNQQLTMRKNDKCWIAKKVNFDTVVDYASFDFTSIVPIILQKGLDYTTGGPPPAVERSVKKAGLRILRSPIYSGPALYFNYGKFAEFADKRVRQALCYAVDHETNGKVSLGESGREIVYYAGISDVMVPQWISPQDQNKLIKYTFDRDKATSLLTAAGWTKQADGWQTPDGKQAAYDLLVPSDYPDWNAAANNLGSQLKDFGIGITVRGVESAQIAPYIRDGKFELAVQAWGSSSNPFPADSFRTALFDQNTPELAPDGKGMDFPLQQQTDVVGDVDLEQVVIDSGLGATPDALKQSTTTAALAFNELLPIIPLWERYGNSPLLDEKIAGYPPDGDPLYNNSIYGDNFTTIWTFEGILKPA